MRSAIHVHPVVTALEEGVADLGQAAAERQAPAYRDRSLDFVAVRPTRPFELEAAIVGNVDLFVGMVYQKAISGDRKPSEVGRGSELIEVGCRHPGLVRHLDDASRVDAIDPAAIIQMNRERRVERWSKRDVAFALPTP